uniref:Putative hydroxypyruvate isomerase n=1 Tax=Dermatophagoides pteronyssinus TaxID=6956 RepID=A0A6P6YL93_DERPT|nr:putative hydroxypyruvate isomerase [Dermatophagoides pteronyssinus]
MKRFKFAANLTTLFKDIPDHIESYKEILNRKDFRFKAVEAQDPYQNSLNDWKNVIEKAGDSRPEFVLINSVNLMKKYPEFPTEKQFENELNLLGEYVKTLNVRKVHMMLTLTESNTIDERTKKLLIQGARFLNRMNVMCLIEPLYLNGIPYYLRSYDDALNLVKELNEPNLKIMFDTYHCQRLHGNICHYIDLLKDHIGHVQISQVPLRDNPFNDGELNHDFILRKLSTVYDDYIGLEYYSDHATDTFDWVKKYVE